MKVGDLIREKSTGRTGLVERIDVDYHGATLAFKVYKPPPRGKCIRGNMVDGFGPTRDGKQDRVMICWTDDFASYLKSGDIEVISESW
jgi:hypothetical protein